MKYTEYRQARDRYDELVEAKRQAEAYFNRYGDGGVLETRDRHRAYLDAAKRELPALAARLLKSWEAE